MDPRTGFPAQGTLSVSVIAPRTLSIAKVWAKPYFINGRQWTALHKPRDFRVFFCPADDANPSAQIPKRRNKQHARGSRMTSRFLDAARRQAPLTYGRSGLCGRPAPLHEVLSPTSAPGIPCLRCTDVPISPRRSPSSPSKRSMSMPPSSSADLLLPAWSPPGLKLSYPQKEGPIIHNPILLERG